MIILGVFMPIIRGWTVMLHVCRIWVSIAMVAKMIYQLSIIDKEYWNSNCTVRLNFLLVMWNRLYQAVIKDKMLPAKLNVLFTHTIVIYFTHKTGSLFFNMQRLKIYYLHKKSLHFTHETEWIRSILLNWMCESELSSINKRNWFDILFLHNHAHFYRSNRSVYACIKTVIYM